jgi:Phosphodiester glycosidase
VLRPASRRTGQPNVPLEPDTPFQPDNGLLPADPGQVPRHRRRRGGRIRRVLRLRTARVILALVAVFCCWLAFSVGQALTAPGGGSMSSKLAEWARDHYLGPVVTFGEWLSYSPPKVGGKPGFSLAVPKSAQAPARPRRASGFQPVIPARLNSPTGHPLSGEGVWRVLETVHGEPAMFGTYLRPSAVYTSYVAGIVSMDQRLLSFQLHPGAEDPGPGRWGEPAWIPPGSRTGLMATFNGGFKLNTAGGGFYLNGVNRGALTDGAASVVYYRNGTIKIGEWGQDVRMTPDVVGVRQNLKLIVDHGRVPASVNENVISSWGATLGGGYYVWRSGLGITSDGRVIFVYGPALDVRELAGLLQRAGAVEALQLDINPYWMSFESYHADGHPADPAPVNLLPTQQQSAYRYYSVYSRDFTAVYAR